jgi:hypothetical protein
LIPITDRQKDVTAATARSAVAGVARVTSIAAWTTVGSGRKARRVATAVTHAARLTITAATSITAATATGVNEVVAFVANRDVVRKGWNGLPPRGDFPLEFHRVSLATARTVADPQSNMAAILARLRCSRIATLPSMHPGRPIRHQEAMSIGSITPPATADVNLPEQLLLAIRGEATGVTDVRTADRPGRTSRSPVRRDTKVPEKIG